MNIMLFGICVVLAAAIVTVMVRNESKRLKAAYYKGLRSGVSSMGIATTITLSEKEYVLSPIDVEEISQRVQNQIDMEEMAGA